MKLRRLSGVIELWSTHRRCLRNGANARTAARSNDVRGDPMSPLMTKEEVCELLRISTRTLDRWRSMWKERKMNPLGEVKIRKRPRFQRPAVEKLLSTPRLWLQEA